MPTFASIIRYKKLCVLCELREKQLFKKTKALRKLCEKIQKIKKAKFKRTRFFD